MTDDLASQGALPPCFGYRQSKPPKNPECEFCKEWRACAVISAAFIPREKVEAFVAKVSAVIHE
jgi:hypothetical protein